MATLSQIAANRRNSQKSTGPRTQAGKAVSRFNALKSGIDAESDVIPCEEAAVLQQLTAEYFDRFQPATPEARFLVDTLITNDWLLRRLRSVEAGVWEHEIYETFNGLDHAVAMAVENQSDVFERLQRRMNAVQRNYHRALADLQRLQLPAQAPQPSAERPALQLTLVPTTPPAPIGFVPPKPQDPPAPLPDALATPRGFAAATPRPTRAGHFPAAFSEPRPSGSVQAPRSR